VGLVHRPFRGSVGYVQLLLMVSRSPISRIEGSFGRRGAVDRHDLNWLFVANG
jgi:hypothetical protein